MDLEGGGHVPLESTILHLPGQSEENPRKPDNVADTWTSYLPNESYYYFAILFCFIFES